MSRTKVLYVTTAGRSGSTLLERSLGSMPGWCAVGELGGVWRRGVIENVRCECGDPFRSCTFWQSVLQRSVGGMDPRVAESFAHRWSEDRLATNLPLLFSERRRQRARALGHASVDDVARLYGAIAEESGARIVVDSSGIPLRPVLLFGRQDIDLYVLHLVRDPRGVAFSWLRTKSGEDTSLERTSVVKAAAWWAVCTEVVSLTAADYGDRLAILRYEDFVRDPTSAFTAIGKLVGEDVSLDTLVAKDGLRLRTTHAISGNPDRFRTGLVPLHLDDRWQTAMSPRDRWTATAITKPWLSRFGYPVRTTGSGSRGQVNTRSHVRVIEGTPSRIDQGRPTDRAEGGGAPTSAVR